MTRANAAGRRAVIARRPVTGRSSRPVLGGSGTPGPIPDPVPPPTFLAGPTLLAKDATSFTITWTIDQVAQGWIQYGPTAAYGSDSAHETSFLYATHVQTVTGLTAGSTVHYRVHAVNTDGEETLSSDATVTLDSAAVSGDYPSSYTPLIWVPLVSASEPALLAPVADQGGQTQIMRISPVAGCRHNYVSLPAFNANGELVNLGYASPNRNILRTSDWTVLHGEQSNTSSLSWYRNDPYLAWCHGTIGIRKLSINPATGTVTVLKTISLSASYAQVVPGGGQGIQDDDDDLIAFLWRKSSGAWGVGVFSLATETVVAERELGTGSTNLTNEMDNCLVSPSGNYVAVAMRLTRAGSGTDQGWWLYESDLNTSTRYLIATQGQHCDWSRAGDGSDRLGYWSGGIRSFEPIAKATTTLLTGFTDGAHVSGQNHLRPGWFYVSSSFQPNGTPGEGMVVAASIDSPGTVENFGHMHRTINYGVYDREPHAVPNPLGTRVVFAGPWEGSASNHCWVLGRSL